MKHFKRDLIIVTMSVLICQAHGQITWSKYPSNPVLPFWRGNENDPVLLHQALEPCVLPMSDGYLMWFSSRTSYGSRSVSMGLSLDGTRWFVYSKNPVLEPGNPGTFDGSGIFASEVIHNGSEYLMYYSGFDGYYVDIGLATSRDGFTWQKYSGNPILTHGPTGSWDAVLAIFPQVVKQGNAYYMWYGGYDGAYSKTGLATSSDGIHWTKYSGNPILIPGASGTWEDRGASVAGIDKVNGLYYMLYRGNNAQEGRVYLGLATSSDGIQWSKYNGNPVVSPGNSGEWDSYQLSGATLLFDMDNHAFDLWYCASGGSNSWEIGRAKSDLVPLGITSVDGKEEETPSGFRLHESYPNPFNPGVIIKYYIPTAGYVSIRIYNSLGEEVVTLVDGQKFRGEYSIVWNARDVPSGVYWYRMVSGDFVESRKMVLVK